MIKAPKGYPYSDEEFNEGLVMLALLICAVAGCAVMIWFIIDSVVSIVRWLM